MLYKSYITPSLNTSIAACQLGQVTNEWGACLPLDRTCIEEYQSPVYKILSDKGKFQVNGLALLSNKPIWRELTKNSESGLAMLTRHAYI